MSTENENARSHWYVFQYANERLSEIITYRNNLIQKVQTDVQTKGDIPADVSVELQHCSNQSVTDDKFERFVNLAKRANYRIFQVFQL